MKNSNDKTKPIPPAKTLERLVSVTEQIKEAIKNNEDNDVIRKLERKIDYIEKNYDLFDRVFEENGMYGMKDAAGNIVVPAIYHDYTTRIHYLSKNAITVPAADESGKFSLVLRDGTGKPVLPFKYDYIQLAGHWSVYIARIDEKYALMCMDGTLITDFIIDEIVDVDFNIITFKSECKYGLLNRNGVLVAPEYDNITVGSDDMIIAVTRGNESGYLDNDGNFVSDDDYDETSDKTMFMTF